MNKKLKENHIVLKEKILQETVMANKKKVVKIMTDIDMQDL